MPSRQISGCCGSTARASGTTQRSPFGAGAAPVFALIITRDPEQNPDDQSRGIHYSAPTLEGCLVEVFGDDGLISTQDRRLGSLRVDRLLRLLDLRGEGAWKAGATQAICSCPSRATSQQWARFFYDTDPELDGLIYGNAHNGADAVALFERADGDLILEHDLALADPRLRSRLLAAAEAVQLVVMD